MADDDARLRVARQRFMEVLGHLVTEGDSIVLDPADTLRVSAALGAADALHDSTVNDERPLLRDQRAGEYEILRWPNRTEGMEPQFSIDQVLAESNERKAEVVDALLAKADPATKTYIGSDFGPNGSPMSQQNIALTLERELDLEVEEVAGAPASGMWTIRAAFGGMAPSEAEHVLIGPFGDDGEPVELAGRDGSEPILVVGLDDPDGTPLYGRTPAAVVHAVRHFIENGGPVHGQIMEVGDDGTVIAPEPKRGRTDG